MMGDLFIGHDMPEPPKESFFKGLFGGGSRSLDREELCKLKKFFHKKLWVVKNRAIGTVYFCNTFALAKWL